MYGTKLQFLYLCCGFDYKKARFMCNNINNTLTIVYRLSFWGMFTFRERIPQGSTMSVANDYYHQALLSFLTYIYIIYVIYHNIIIETTTVIGYLIFAQRFVYTDRLPGSSPHFLSTLQPPQYRYIALISAPPTLFTTRGDFLVPKTFP